MSEPLRTVNVGLIGLGTVGGGVARLIKSHHDEYLAAYGIDLKLTRACALAWEQAEAAGIEREAFTSDWHDVVTDPAVDIVVELIGRRAPRDRNLHHRLREWQARRLCQQGPAGPSCRDARREGARVRRAD